MMTVQTFLSLLIVLATANTLMTQAMKKFMDDGGYKYSSNILALVDAVIVGVCGTSIYYAFTNKPFDADNIILIILMTLAVWMSSMIEFDKIRQLLIQISELK